MSSRGPPADTDPNESLLTFPIVRVMDVFLGRALLELATWMTVSFIIYTGLILAGIAPLPDSVMKMLAAMIALFCIAFGAGLFIGIVGEFWASMRSFMSVPMRLLYFTSAVFYLPDPLPPAIRDILAWNPILHAITLVREGYYRGYQSHLLDVGYLYSWAIGCVLVGLVAEQNRAQAHAKLGGLEEDLLCYLLCIALRMLREIPAASRPIAASTSPGWPLGGTEVSPSLSVFTARPVEASALITFSPWPPST